LCLEEETMGQFVKENLSLIVVVFILVAAYFLLRNRPSQLNSLEEFNALIAGGRPVVVEFFSNT